jgi:amino acid transporter
MVSIFIGGLGFILLQLCSAELTSTVPFSGGSYGFTRLAFGRQFGVLVGLTETLGYVAIASCILIGLILDDATKRLATQVDGMRRCPRNLAMANLTLPTDVTPGILSASWRLQLW